VFDLDGVLVDSMAAVRAQWIAWGAQHGVPREDLLAALHMTGEDLVRRFAPQLDPAREARSIAAVQAAAETEIHAYDGARELVAALPRERWAVVTSALRVLALRHLALAALPLPSVLIAADEAPRGKPDPSGYLLAAARLRFAPSACVAIEDAPAGMAAARAAGMTVVGVASTHAPAELDAAATVVDRLGDLAIALVEDGIELRTGGRTIR